MPTSTAAEQLVSVFRDTVVALVRRDGPDPSARQLGVFLTCYLQDGNHTVRGLAAELNVSKPAITRALVDVDKQGLHPFRLGSILALAWLVARLVPAGATWLRSRWAAPFILCGQHSLPVFCSGIFLSFLGRLALEEHNGWVVQAGVNLAGAAALLGVGALAAWYREKGRQHAPAPHKEEARVL